MIDRLVHHAEIIAAATTSSPKISVDRLTHKAHIIETGEESWRFRHGLARREKGKK